MKKHIYMFFFLILCFLSYISAEQKEKIIKEYELDLSYETDKEILNNYGGLWLIYAYSDSIILNQSERKSIKEISFYYKRNNNYIFLGKYNKYGIYNNKEELIFINPYADYFIGYIDTILEDPFYLGQYAYEDGKRPGGFEPYVKVFLNFQKNSIDIKVKN